MLAPWLALTWGILGAGAWAFNGVRAVTSDAEPSLDALLFALALTVTGVTVGITFSVVVGLIGRGRHPDNATAEEQSLWMLPMGVGLLGLVTAPLFDGSPLSTMDWVLLAAGALAGGFVLGTVPRVRPRRVPAQHRTRLAHHSPGAVTKALANSLTCRGWNA
jgi:hypothetical protein